MLWQQMRGKLSPIIALQRPSADLFFGGVRGEGRCVHGRTLWRLGLERGLSGLMTRAQMKVCFPRAAVLRSPSKRFRRAAQVRDT